MNVWLYGDPTVASAGVALVMAGAVAAGTTTRVTARVSSVPMPLVTVTVKFVEPSAVGVPVSSPVGARTSPAGREPVVTANVGAG